MATERTRELVKPDQFVHPRQTYLLNRLESGSLPDGAEEMMQDAIAEYQSAFENTSKEKDSPRSIATETVVSFPEDAERQIIAGKNHILTVHFGNFGNGEPLEETPEEVFAYLAVVVNLINLPGTELYPDWLRYVAVDHSGKSRVTPFLLQIPDSPQGLNSRIKVQVLNGGNQIADRSLDFSLV